MGSRVCRSRLTELLAEANTLVKKELQLSHIDGIKEEDRGNDKQIAAFVQGWNADDSTGLLKAIEQRFGKGRDWMKLLDGGEIAYVTNYGLEDKERVFLGKGLEGGGVIKVWEADLMLLDSADAERLQMMRKKLGGLKMRIELCAKITYALEGNGGKRFRKDRVDGWKAKLQKMEQAAVDAEMKAAKAEEAAKKRELRELKKATKAAEKLEQQKRKCEREKKKKDIEDKKAKKNKSTLRSAMFMARFVKPRGPTAQEVTLASCPSSKIKDYELSAASIKTSSRGSIYASDTSAGALMNKMKFFPESDIDKHLPFKGNSEDYSLEGGLEWILSRAGNLRRAAMASIQNIRFIKKRSDFRGRSPTGHVIKLLQFHDSYRPQYFGTWANLKFKSVHGRRPFGRDSTLNYDYDSDAEWEEDEPGESLSDVDNEEEEDELLDMFSSEAEDDDFLVKDDNESDVASECSSQREGSGVRISASAPSTHHSLKPGDDSRKLELIVVDDKDDGRDGNESEPALNAGVKRGISLMEVARGGTNPKKRVKSACKKRQRRHVKELVMCITGVILDGAPNQVLDQFPVIRGSLDGAISKYDPTKEDTGASESNESTHGKVSSSTGSEKRRAPLDEKGQIELARFVHHSALSRERLIEEFCEKRRAADKPVSKAEVNRRLREIAERQKLGQLGNVWVLKNDNLSEKLGFQKSERDQKSSIKTSPITPGTPETTGRVLTESVLAGVPRRNLFTMDNTDNGVSIPKPVSPSPIDHNTGPTKESRSAPPVPVVTID